jgi:hypothetical protein
MEVRAINIDPEILGGTPVFLWHSGAYKKSF